MDKKKKAFVIAPLVLLLLSCSKTPESNINSDNLSIIDSVSLSTENSSGDEIENIAHQISGANMIEHVTELTKPIYDGRSTASPGNELAMSYVANKFSEFDLLDITENDYIQPYVQSQVRYLTEYPAMNIKDSIGNVVMSPQYIDTWYFTIISLDYLPSNNINLKNIPLINYSSSYNSEKYRNKIVLVPAQNLYSFFYLSKTYAGFIIESAASVTYPNIETGVPYFSDNTSIFYAFMQNQQFNTLKNYVAQNSSATIDISYQMKTSASETGNIVGYLPSNNSSDETVIISSHIDHIGRYGELDNQIFPGALDNASGTAAVIETARVLSLNKDKLDKNYLFICFNGEENGLYGSYFYVNNPLVPLNNTSVLNLDMIGSNKLEDAPLYVIGKFKTTSQKNLFSIKFQKYGVPYTLVSPTHNDYDSLVSDHYYFVEEGITAISLVHDDVDHYHRPHDVVETLNENYFSLTTKASIEYALAI